ncbi:AAA family ATPase [Runella slithyformis]|uniref:ATPase associated with various cellular activities AAA_3 n=1 Tax=Runella slithyformis (strain ATCC 29530 / DSM 19594 / LMG 11500 / NCIMB 11436 / LSU 4) TaxID=761193 RepID=A0A7U3ZJG6_RUNSL|nr:MoxR family ATPase [Runella slithyformis]AEI48292.1 ATPase associated with various cellular activities AAA_3 [Runella slithyformis DSM 19594]
MNFESRIDLQDLNDAISAIKSEIGKIIVGQHTTIELLLTAILADGHVLVEGVPGVAKTLTAKLLAKTINTEFSRIQFTPDLMPSDVLGTSIFNPKLANFEFMKGPIFSNIILVDEINRAPAKTQSALFEVMEERQATIDGTTYPMSSPFIVIATQNPVEHEGTYRLPEAQLDRFLFKIVVGYPTAEQEVEVLRGHHLRKNMAEAIADITSILQPQQLAELRAKTHQVHVEDKLLEYLAQIILQTRNNKSLFLGASPRASVALLNSSKALAAIRGRDFVTPEDIQALAPAVLRHRIILMPEREMEGATPDDIVAQLLQKVEVPR